MILVHTSVEEPGNGACRFERRILEPAEPIPDEALWVDLVEPTREEDRKTEQHFGISIPTREELSDIEPSELLYTENGAQYLTVRLVYNTEQDPDLTGVSFIIKDKGMITVRYAEPKAFQMFTHRIAKPGTCDANVVSLLATLLDTVIDRAADVLQATGSALDTVSRTVFEAKGDPGRRNEEYQSVLKALGRHNDLISKIRESLVSVERALLFVSSGTLGGSAPKALRENIKSTLRDLQSLEEHATFQSQKIQFLLDATLGLVNLEQNNIIKLFSVMAVIFMPPTLIASVYGMNFKIMPELEWPFGYPMALGMMVLAAVLPYLIFRWKKWL